MHMFLCIAHKKACLYLMYSRYRSRNQGCACAVGVARRRRRFLGM